MSRRKEFERWETKISNSEVTSHAVWPLAKSLMRRDRPKTPNPIHGSPALKVFPLENQFTTHGLCEENHEGRVEVRGQALSEAVDDSPPERVRRRDVQKLMKPLKLRKDCRTDGIPNECLRHLLRRPLVHLTPNQSLPSAVAFSVFLEGRKSDNKIPSKLTTDKSPIHNRQAIPES
jgi:hypothetical protein